MIKSKFYKVIFMGTADFALAPLQQLLNDQSFEVMTVVTQPDKIAFRDKKLTPPPVKLLALANNLAVIQPKKLIDSLEIIQGLNPDFIITAAYGRILPQEILNIPKYGCLNIHPSLLPKYRGASPINAALLAGDTETGVSILDMTDDLDSGDIYTIKRVSIQKDDDYRTLAEKLSLISAYLLVDTLHLFIESQITKMKQNELKALCCRKIYTADGQIWWSLRTAEEIFNQIRAFTPSPGCFTFWKNKRLKICQTDLADNVFGEPGKIFLHDKKMMIYAKKGALIVKRLQLEGKKEMDTVEFLKGNETINGNILI